MRVVIALGGNAMTGPDGSATPTAQRLAVEGAAPALAGIVAAGHQLVITHGNGPQVGNLLVKNELAANVVPPVPLDWCGAQTQGTIAALLLNALDVELVRNGLHRPVAAVVTRTLVDGDDPGFTRPSKPIGRYLPADEAEVLVAHGQVWADRGERGWRRMVASPEPLEVLDLTAVRVLLDNGFVVVCAGGGGIPTIRDPSPAPGAGRDGRLVGVQAVIDKDLTAAVLAIGLHADMLVIATDVDHVLLGFDGPGPHPLRRVTVAQLREHAAGGQFDGGSMGPKVEAVCRFVETTGRRAAITSLHRIAEAVSGAAGTLVSRGDGGDLVPDALVTHE